MIWTELRGFRGLVIRYPLVVAFTLSLTVHVALFGGWKIGKRLGWWEHQATWLLDWKKKLHPKHLQPKLEQASTPAQQEIPLTFVEVDPSIASAEPPKDAKYYSSQNTRASNPDPLLDTVVPKIDGQQKKIPRVEDVPKPAPQPLQPAPPEKAPDPEPPKPKKEEIGDLAKAKPNEIPVMARERPRTLAQARERKAMTAGEKMEQEGGVRERSKYALNVKRTPFGSYDAALVAAVQQRWYDLLDNTQFAQRSGKVVLEFRLYYDGRITDMKVDGNDVGEMLGLLCQRAILDPAPFAEWPSDMRRAVGKNYRDVQFTFYYN